MKHATVASVRTRPLHSRFESVLVAVVALCAVSPLASPPPGREWTPFPAMTDEFDGDQLDGKKWYDHNPTWRGRRPVRFHPDCVAVSNGILRVSAMDAEASSKREPGRGFTHISGFVRSRAVTRFGCFEMRAKLMDSTLVSCFWLTHVGDEEWSEIDVVEVPAGIPRHERTLHPNLHYFHGPHYRGSTRDHLTDPSSHPLPFRMADDFHVYGVEWTPTHIRWYVDGEQIRETENTHHFQPLEMNMNVEANQYFDALPDDRRLPAVYEIDWVRAWRPKGF